LQDQSWLASQRRGPSSALLSDIKPSSSEGTDLKYTLNAEIIHSIFIQYPAVHRAYQDNVPDKISEKEFWTKYFSSQYFYRKRLGVTGGSSQAKGKSADKNKDLFEQYASIDEDGMFLVLDVKTSRLICQKLDSALTLNNLEYIPTNRLLDLTSTAEDHTKVDYNKFNRLKYVSISRLTI
jgi:transcription initiation factor TFIIH subunit 1